MKDGYSIVYGGFATDKVTGKEELLFETTYSELLCRKRVEEEIHNRNLYAESNFDLDSIKIRCQKLETTVSPWRESEGEALSDSAIIRKKDYWYIECWTDADLEDALQSIGIPINDENIKLLKQSCKSIFDDKSERNTMLGIKANELFNTISERKI